MITKERLEELIEQGATIYGIDDRWDIVEVRELDAQQIYYSSSNANYQYVFDDHSVVEFFDDKLFETKEDAEEYAEFGNIPRIEWLELPSWEDVLKGEDISIHFQNQRKDIAYELYVDAYKGGIFIEKDHEVIWIRPTTRENYNEARRLCVKLFKGEDV